MSRRCAVTSLVQTLVAWAAGEVAATELQDVFEAAPLYVQRVPGPDGGPAIAVIGAPGAGAVPMYTSLETLAAAAGECDWARGSGRDLLAFVPDGYGVMVDPGTPHTALLPAESIRRGVVISRVAP
jgi:SseB protein N-terminal domain